MWPAPLTTAGGTTQDPEPKLSYSRRRGGRNRPDMTSSKRDLGGRTVFNLTLVRLVASRNLSTGRETTRARSTSRATPLLSRPRRLVDLRSRRNRYVRSGPGTPHAVQSSPRPHIGPPVGPPRSLQLYRSDYRL